MTMNINAIGTMIERGWDGVQTVTAPYPGIEIVIAGIAFAAVAFTLGALGSKTT